MELIFYILPDFILVTLGWLLYNKLKYSESFFEHVEKLVYFVMFPALLFRSILHTDITLSSATTYAIVCLILALIGLFLAHLASRFIQSSAISLASIKQCAYRFNTYLALSLAASIGGKEGIGFMAIIIGLSVPMVNIMAVKTLAAQQQGGYWHLFKAIISNPYVIATLSGLILNLLTIEIPLAIDLTLEKLGSASVSLGLICVGAALIFNRSNINLGLALWTSAVRLVCLPLIALILSFIFGFNAMQTQMFVIFGALPSASSAYILTVRMGGDGQLVASTISLTTVLCIFTIPFWIFIANLLN